MSAERLDPGSFEVADTQIYMLMFLWSFASNTSYQLNECSPDVWLTRAEKKVAPGMGGIRQEHRTVVAFDPALPVLKLPPTTHFSHPHLTTPRNPSQLHQGALVWGAGEAQSEQSPERMCIVDMNTEMSRTLASDPAVLHIDNV